MASTSGVCNSYKAELAQGIHAAADVYKAAIFTSAATLNKATTVYAATNEAAGAGYTAGGQILAGFAVTLDGDTAVIDFTDPLWNPATLTGRTMLIYNSSKANRAVAVYDFGIDITSSNGPWTVELPAATAAAGLLRLS